MNDLGILIVADFAEANIKVFDLHAEGNTPPFFVTSNLGETASGEPREAWGLSFDDDRNRLFVAATDGTVLGGQTDGSQGVFRGVATGATVGNDAGHFVCRH